MPHCEFWHLLCLCMIFFFFFQAEDGIRDYKVTGVQTCALFFFSSRRRHTRLQGDWSSDVCSSDLRNSMCSVPFVAHQDNEANSTMRKFAFTPLGAIPDAY